MDFPKLQAGQHAVITAEVRTGIVLRLDGQYRQEDSGEGWRVFDSLAAAREFAVAEVAKNPEVEFGIYDEKQKPVQVIRHKKYDHLA
jgi:hypothetical protein